MRMTAIAIVLVATPALAQPSPEQLPAQPQVAEPTPSPAQPRRPAPMPDEAAPCQASVTLSRAPADVRAVVDTWVHTEPSCGHALDVSVDAVDDGYVVNARDSSGRLRVRIVPDADTLGVLIASWSADDRVEPGDPPGLAMPIDRSDRSGREAAAPGGRRILLAGLASAMPGARGEFDLFGRRILVGIAASAIWTVGESQRTDSTETVTQRRLQAVAYLGVAYTSAQWQLRAQVGAGAQQVHGIFRSFGADTEYSVVDPIAELSLTASRALGAGLGLTAGVVITEPLTESWPYSDGAQYNTSKVNEPVPMALLGLSWGL